MVRRPGGPTLSFTGDTGIFGVMALIREIYRPDLAALPLGDHHTIGPGDAAHAIRLLGVPRALPFHSGLMPTLTGTPEALREATRKLPNLQVHAQPGETLSPKGLKA
nr:hypothetical protein [Deinococcus hopiensis]